MNIRERGKRLEWTLEEKVLVVKIETEEKERGSGFMKCVKKRWSNEARTKKIVSTQNLVDNARRFNLEEEVIRQLDGQSEKPESEALPESMHWTKANKVRLVEIDTEERERGLGFIKRVGDRWDQEFGERLKDQMLRDNATRFNKEKQIANLVLVKMLPHRAFWKRS